MSYGPCRIGLIVTGKGEASFLHDLFNREMMPRAYCLFEVVRYFPQLRPTNAQLKKQTITGTNQPAPTRDQELGLAAFGYLRSNERSFIMVVDDLEGDPPVPVFERYRKALDSVIQKPGLDKRAAVYFLANMIEAYYFAHSAAVNVVAGRDILDADHPTDVETINHPKRRLRGIWNEFHEIRHGKKIIAQLDLQRVLQRPTECCWIRALLTWCVDKLEQEGAFYDPFDRRVYHIDSGCKSSVCYPQ